ncbi:MAG: hypothetical protein COA47_10440 [Robiginitomaculum sp.]|nr:MAG: hypothetical protein COA47_10440 [Robiginitomaculum sp.]
MAVTKTVFIGVDNLTKIRLLTLGVPADLSEVTRIVIVVDTITVDSDINPSAIDWTTPTEIGEVWLKFGLLFSVAASAQEARITIYDVANPNGIRWEDDCGNPELLIEVCL